MLKECAQVMSQQDVKTRRGEMMSSDACRRHPRHVYDLFAAASADEHFERTAVAHFQSARYHSLMAGSLIRDETGCHSLPLFWCKEPPFICHCAVQYVSC